MFFPNPCVKRNAGDQDDVVQDSASITTLLSESKKALEQKKKATRLLLLGLSIHGITCATCSLVLHAGQSESGKVRNISLDTSLALIQTHRPELRVEECARSFSLLISDVTYTGTDFQLAFAPKQFNIDRTMWRLVIHLNVLRCVSFALHACPLSDQYTLVVKSGRFSISWS